MQSQSSAIILLSAYYNLELRVGKLQWFKALQLQENTPQDLRPQIRDQFKSKGEQASLIRQLTMSNPYPIWQIHQEWVKNMQIQLSQIRKALKPGNGLDIDVAVIQFHLEAAELLVAVASPSMVEGFRTLALDAAILVAPQNIAIAEELLKIQAMFRTFVVAWDIAFYLGY